MHMNIQIGTLVSAPNYNDIQMKSASYPCRDIVHKILRDRVCTQGYREGGRRRYEKVKMQKKKYVLNKHFYHITFSTCQRVEYYSDFII